LLHNVTTAMPRLPMSDFSTSFESRYSIRARKMGASTAPPKQWEIVLIEENPEVSSHYKKYKSAYVSCLLLWTLYGKSTKLTELQYLLGVNNSERRGRQTWKFLSLYYFLTELSYQKLNLWTYNFVEVLGIVLRVLILEVSMDFLN